eukprot:GHVH01000497.1.p1 GENE.GHVH01000497.1~~GHVH01000497.1.p1  ORF type:complete len:192 (-),score=22.88 GHVH01000497.1:145-720(-)
MSSLQNANPAGSHPYPDVFPPAAGYPLYKNSPLFAKGCLKDRHNQVIDWEALRGKSVALLFADPKHYKTCSFMPMLLQFYRTMNENGDRQNLEVIFIPTLELKADQVALDEFVIRMPWLHFDGDEAALDQVIDHYRILLDLNKPCKYGYPFLTEAPGMVVIDESGATLQKLQVDELGRDALLKWDYYRDTL